MRAIHAEWTKIRTAGGTGRLVAATIVLTVALGAAVCAASRHVAGDAMQDPTKLSLTGVALGQAWIAIVAVSAISGEYGSGMMRTTVTAMPNRLGVLGAKSVVVAGIALATGFVAVAGSLLAGRLILPGNGFTVANGYSALSPADGPTLRAAIGSMLYFALIALLALGLATAVRDAAASIAAVLGLLYVFPIVSHIVGDPHWQRRLGRYAPMAAGLAVQVTTNVSQSPIGPWLGLGVTALWSVAALLAGSATLQLRDA